MVGVGGTTKRLKIILRFTLIFMGGLLYSMAYHDKIGDLFGWDDGWIGVTVAVAIVCVYLCRRALAKRLTDPTSER